MNTKIIAGIVIVIIVIVGGYLFFTRNNKMQTASPVTQQITVSPQPSKSTFNVNDDLDQALSDLDAVDK